MNTINVSRKNSVGLRVEATPRRLGVAATPSSPVRGSGLNSDRKTCDGGVAFTCGDEASPLPSRASTESLRVNTHLKFNCIYCGQHMKCDPRFSGRQILCPACLHRIVIPTARGSGPVRQALPTPRTWDIHVPLPSLEIPTRHRNAKIPNLVLAH